MLKVRPRLGFLFDYLVPCNIQNTMSNVFSSLLHSSTITILVDSNLHEKGFRIVGPGLLGGEHFTSPILTQEILNSPEFDQLSSTDKAQRILEIALKTIERQ